MVGWLDAESQLSGLKQKSASNQRFVTNHATDTPLWMYFRPTEFLSCCNCLFVHREYDPSPIAFPSLIESFQAIPNMLPDICKEYINCTFEFLYNNEKLYICCKLQLFVIHIPLACLYKYMYSYMIYYFSDFFLTKSCSMDKIPYLIL